MSRLTDKIVSQRNAGLISSSEARTSLRRLAKQSRFNADYSDSPDSYTRWDREASSASRALTAEPLVWS